MKTLNPLRWLALLGGVVAMVSTTSALAQAQEDAAELGRITVTGSRISRQDLEGAQPIVVLTADDMQQRGYVTVFQALSDLTQNNGFKFEAPESPGGFTPGLFVQHLLKKG